MKKLLTLTLLILFVLTSIAGADDDDWIPLQTGSMSFRLGWFSPWGESDLWLENSEDFTFEIGDFNSFLVGAEYNWFLNKYVTLGFALDFYSKSVNTEYRDFEGDEGLPIEQTISLSVIPVTATVKLTPLGNGSPGYGGERGSSIVPWVGGGVGVYAFTYEEDGEFIDFSDDSIFLANFITEEGGAFGVHVAAGLVIPLGLEWDIFGEARYAWAEGDLSEDFTGDEPLDVGGFGWVFGASYRF